MTGAITARMLRQAKKMELFGRAVLVLSLAAFVVWASADPGAIRSTAALFGAEIGLMFVSMGRYAFHPSTYVRAASMIAPMVLIFGTAVALSLP